MKEAFAKPHLSHEFWEFLNHFLERLGFIDFSNIFDLMNKIAPGSELTVLVLMKIPANFFPQGWLITYEFIDSMGEETGLAISTETILCPTFA